MSVIEWSKWLDPEFSSSVYSALFASGTALYLGVRTYKNQKQEDRKQELLVERRKIYLEYLAASSACYWWASDGRKDDFIVRREKYFTARDRVRLVSPRDIVDVVDRHAIKIQAIMDPEGMIHITEPSLEHVTHLENIGDALEPERAVMADVIEFMRKDLISHSTYKPEFPELDNIARKGVQK